MIRSAFLMGFTLLAGVVFIVFEIENRVDKLRASLSSINKELLADKEEIHVLKAEWAYLNKPERLKKISEKHFAGQYSGFQQIKKIEDIPFNSAYLAGNKAASESKQAAR